MFDTHCHIHGELFELDANGAYEEAIDSGLEGMFCVGTSAQDSQLAAEFAQSHEKVWASIGHHPHEAKDFDPHDEQVMALLARQPKVVAIGECGLDYFYEHSPKKLQEKVFRWQLELAQKNNLPVIFHIRGSRDNPQDAFDDLWRILDDFPDVRGVIHSFSATSIQLEQILKRGLYVGINGIMTFTQDEDQIAALSKIPLEKLLFETDAPFLTPKPFRGKVNRPSYLKLVVEQIGERTGVEALKLANITTENVKSLFEITEV